MVIKSKKKAAQIKEEAAQLKERPPVSDEEIRESFAGPALHSNKVLLTFTGTGVRLAFMEQLGEKVPAKFRTAVMLSFQDALQVRDLISRQLADIEKDIAAAIAEAQEPPSNG